MNDDGPSATTRSASRGVRSPSTVRLEGHRSAAQHPRSDDVAHPDTGTVASASARVTASMHVDNPRDSADLRPSADVLFFGVSTRDFWSFDEGEVPRGHRMSMPRTTKHQPALGEVGRATIDPGSTTRPTRGRGRGRTDPARGAASFSPNSGRNSMRSSAGRWRMLWPRASSFAAVARDLGITRQAVHRRFRGLAAAETPLGDGARGSVASCSTPARRPQRSVPTTCVAEHIVLAVLRASRPGRCRHSCGPRERPSNVPACTG